MQSRKNRIGCAVVTLVGGTVAGSWWDPETFAGTVPVQIALEYAPLHYWCQRTAGGGGGQGHVRITAVTVNGFTLTSSDVTDVGTFRVYGVCRADDL